MLRAPALVILSCALFTSSVHAEPSELERKARARWFEFELAPVIAKHGGDWARVTAELEAADEALLSEVKKHPSGMFDMRITLEGVRSGHLSQREFVEVAQARRAEIIALARSVILAIQQGELDPLAEDCTMYDAKAKDRRELSRAYLREHKAAFRKAVAGIDPMAPDFGRDLEFVNPLPETGMVGQVLVPFGKPYPSKKRNDERYPDRHQIELWWSGEIRPEANGVMFSAPGDRPRPKIRWRFYDLVLPYSRKPSYLL